ncbi:hypothetical protein OIU78_029527 [Salix suchowensis]|nr:hypothetical protein OIU78_029527 [Salix suchowensis]
MKKRKKMRCQLRKRLNEIFCIVEGHEQWKKRRERSLEIREAVSFLAGAAVLVQVLVAVLHAGGEEEHAAMAGMNYAGAAVLFNGSFNSWIMVRKRGKRRQFLLKKRKEILGP